MISDTQRIIGQAAGASRVVTRRSGGRFPRLSSRSYLLKHLVDLAMLSSWIVHLPIEQLSHHFVPAPTFLVR